jgi:hypothetical protein
MPGWEVSVSNQASQRRSVPAIEAKIGRLSDSRTSPYTVAATASAIPTSSPGQTMSQWTDWCFGGSVTLR